MDYFSILLTHLKKTEVNKGVTFHKNSSLTHIPFAYDILLFIENNDSYLKNLHMAIILFEKVSSLNINLSKSSIFPINVFEARANSIANVWKITFQHLPLSYMGLPPRKKSQSKAFWENIEEKIHKKLNIWKYSHILKWGQRSLLSNQLSVYPPINFLSLKPRWQCIETLRDIGKTFSIKGTRRLMAHMW